MRRILISLILLALLAIALPALAQSTATPALIPTTTPTPLPATATSTPLPVTNTPTPAAEVTSPESDRVEAGSIEVGDSIDGSLSFESPSVFYTLEGASDLTVSITLTSDDFDSYLTVEDESGNIIAFNDDSNGERNSRIASLTVPEDASYIVIVESYGHHVGSGTQEGDFTLSVSEIQVRRIEYTQTVEDELTSNELAHDYVFSGSSGDTVIINLNAEDFDAYLYLLDSSGNQLVTNDDSGGSLNSQIGPYVLPSTGSYTIRASSLGGSDTGDYTLRLNRIESQSIAYGDTIEVEFTDRNREFFFTFTGAYGDIVSAEVDSDRAVDTSLTLSDPYNSQIATDDDSGSGFDPELLGTSLFSDGTFTLLVRAVGDGNGTVSLTLDRVPPTSLEDGATLSFSSSVNQVPTVFEGVAGEVVRLTLAMPEGTQSTSLSVAVRQDGISVSDFSGYNVATMVVEFTVPNDGEVSVMVSEYSYTNTQIDVTLEHLN